MTVCPLLGLRHDPSTCGLYPRGDHVCRSPGAPAPSLAWQARYCLTGEHRSCPHYGAGEPVQSAPTPASARRWRQARVIAAATVVIGLVVAAAGMGAMARSSLSSEATPSPGITERAAGTPALAGAVLTAQRALTPTPVPAPSPTPVPSPTPTPSPTPLPPAPTPTPPPPPPSLPAPPPPLPVVRPAPTPTPVPPPPPLTPTPAPPTPTPVLLPPGPEPTPPAGP